MILRYSHVMLMALAVLAGALVSGCNAIVGATCRESSVCEGVCIDLTTDPTHCGACGVVCSAGLSCVAGSCVAGLDGGFDAGVLIVDGGDSGLGPLDGGDSGLTPRDGGDSGLGPRDGGDSGFMIADGGDATIVRDAAGSDAGMPLCGLGEILCMGVCVDALTDPMNCGGCGNMCPAGQFCAAGRCQLMCDPPLMLCAGECIDTTSDPDNCGGCGIVCPSGICIDSECSGPLAGHVVLVGHDYVERRRGMSRLVGNAVFLARGNPVRLLVWEGDAAAAAIAGTDAAIAQTASESGRSVDRVEPGDATEIPFFLANADAFLVYAQQGAMDATLRSLGASLSRALTQFVQRGGVVIVLDGSTGAHMGSWQVLDSAGLLSCTGRTPVTGATIDVTAPADAVALRVPLSYLAERTTVRFTSSESVAVSGDGMGPVVIHRTVTP